MSTALGLAALLCINTSAKATLIAYEGFNYAANTGLTNASGTAVNDGSFGWVQQWRPQSGDVGYATNRVGSFTYTDSFANNLIVNGGHVDVGRGLGANPTSGNAQLVRNLAFGPLTGATANTFSGLSNGTFYVSFLVKLLGPVNVGIGAGGQYTRQASMHFYPGLASNTVTGGSQYMTFGVPNVSDWGAAANTNGAAARWDVWTGADGATSGDRDADISAIPVTDTTLVVMRMDLSGGPGMDTVYTWLNPANLTIASSLGSAVSVVTNNLDLMNQIRLQANGFNGAGTNANISFDEIRIGTTWQDVLPVPEPSIIAIGGVALSGLWLSIRRRRQS